MFWTESRNIQQTQVCLGFLIYFTCVLWVANIENPHCFGEFYPFDEDGIESEVAFGQRSWIMMRMSSCEGELASNFTAHASLLLWVLMTLVLFLVPGADLTFLGYNDLYVKVAVFKTGWHFPIWSNIAWYCGSFALHWVALILQKWSWVTAQVLGRVKTWKYFCWVIYTCTTPLKYYPL